MSDQLKSTGEWTAQTVFDLLGRDYGSDGWKRERTVADAHNAALDAAKAGGWLSREALDEYAKVEQEVQQLRDQLAAAQAAIAHCVRIWKMRGSDDHWEGNIQNTYNHCATELTERSTDTAALDAAIAAATKPLMELLLRMNEWFKQQKFNGALMQDVAAKVKEEK